MSKYFVCDIYSHASEHSMFVESFIDYFNQKDDTIFLLNDKHSLFLAPESRKIKFPLRDSICNSKLIRLFNREIVKTFSLLFMLPYILLSKRQLVILGTSNIQSFIVSLLNILPFLRVSIVLHGQVESLVKPIKDRRRFGGIFIKAFNKIHKSNRFNILVLGEHIKNNLLMLGYENIYSIPHPIPKSALAKSVGEQKKSNAKHEVAIIGLIRNDSKNCNKIYELNLDESVSLHVIGRAAPDFKIIEGHGVQFKLWNNIFLQSELELAITHIDSFLYFFGENNYKFTASATALDAIIYGKAVFSLKNEAVASLLREYDLFFEFENLTDMAAGINNFDLSSLINVDFNAQREKYLINNFNLEIEEWLC